MKIGILISTGDPEIIWNAFRFANLCMNTNVDDDVSIFMHAKAVEYESCDSEKFNIKELAKTFVLSDGKLLACGKCLGFRGLEENDICRKGSQKDLYEMVMTSEKLICF
jgi:tRNA 2-thiouridine synthesizing protein D